MDSLTRVDEALARPLELLARYRELCEKAGAFQGSGTRVPRQIAEELARTEAELQTRLWLSSADGSPRTPERQNRTQNSVAPPRIEPQPAAPVIPSPGASSDSKTATVFSDGACLGNPGPGGYAAIVRVPGQPDREIYGSKAKTTNNEMELTAALEGLKTAVSLGATDISVVSDSEYLVKGMTGWIQNWIRKGWKTTMGNPVKNRQLWEELYSLTQGRSVSWSWTRGHQGHRENERCDTLATAAAREAAGFQNKVR